jgi:hypothetical protein
MTASRNKLEKRLSSYWKMELANVGIVPAVMFYFANIAGSPVGWMSYFTMIAMCGLLLIGGLYWRGKHAQFRRDVQPLETALKWAHYMQTPLLVLTVIACLLTILSWWPYALARGTGDRVVATITATLAALEYVNYYHRQIQHFDHLADFKRLLTGRGFRLSQMNRDLKTWRARNTQH